MPKDHVVVSLSRLNMGASLTLLAIPPITNTLPKPMLSSICIPSQYNRAQPRIIQPRVIASVSLSCGIVLLPAFGSRS